MARNFEFLIGNVYWLFKKMQTSAFLRPLPPLMSANVCNWVPPPPLKIADVLCGRPLRQHTFELHMRLERWQYRLFWLQHRYRWFWQWLATRCWLIQRKRLGDAHVDRFHDQKGWWLNQESLHSSGWKWFQLPHGNPHILQAQPIRSKRNGILFT